MPKVSKKYGLRPNFPADGKEQGTSPRLRTADQLRATAAKSLVAREIAKDLDEALKMVDEQF